MQYQAVRLTFKSALHIGAARAEYDKSNSYIHSDTLYAAITRMWLMLGIPLDNLYKDWAVSSLFPFAKVNGKYEYFFPKPFMRLRNNQSEAPNSDAKKWKKVQWYSADCFADVLKGKIDQNTNQIRGKFLLSSEPDTNEEFNIITSQITPRNQVSRMQTEDTTIFYVDRLYFQPDCGLWFLLATENDDIKQKIEYALNLLAEEGLGTDRNVGMGQFDYQFSNNCDCKSEEFDMSKFHFKESNAQAAISLYCPENAEEIDNKLSGYELIHRGGWVTDEANYTYRKKSVTMFKEGSVFAFQSPDLLIKGNSNIDLTPDIIKNQKVLRCGKAIFLPCKI